MVQLLHRTAKLHSWDSVCSEQHPQIERVARHSGEEDLNTTITHCSRDLAVLWIIREEEPELWVGSITRSSPSTSPHSFTDIVPFGSSSAFNRSSTDGLQ